MAEQQDAEGWQEALRKIEAVKRSSAPVLDLSGLELTRIPLSIAELNHLRELNINRNQLRAIPEFLSQLSNLQSLYLWHNQLTAIPDSLSQLRNLELLDVSENQLTDLPDSLSALSNLQTLDLSGNQLVAIPESLANLVKLKELDLSDNRLTKIPKVLASLPELTTLLLHGNPTLGVPNEILGPTSAQILRGKPSRSPREILEYMNRLGDARPLNEAKLIMVGQGGVGKTSLVKSLSTGKFKPGERTTEGIRISDWTLRVRPKDEITVHIWDFGGQEMMHATHQFFLTQRSLYLLVLNRRPGGIDREADYWFRLIRAFGGRDAPVIVALNKQRTEPFDVNRVGWLEKYAGNIKGFVETDCTDGKSIRLLKREIQEELQRLTSVKASFPRRWFAIKDELSHMNANYITFEGYRAICSKHGEQDPENQILLAGFLHDLGIALNYKDDPRLRFAYVLKPEWVTEGIYALLHAFVKNKGLFSRPEAEKVLETKGYSQETTEFILGLMEQFELCFPLGDAQRRVLIPQLLDDKQPEEALTFSVAKCLNFGYQYTIVPEGLLPRFIVRTQHLSKAAARWKSGVILHDASTACRALVRADSAEAQVRVHIDGPEASRRELLAVIRYNFDVIHSDYEFRPINLVYPPGVTEKPLRLDDLEALAHSGVTSMPVVLSDSTVINPRIIDLIEPVKPAPPPLKLFLSYSQKDEKYVHELRKDLKLMERNGLIRTWYDQALTAGEKWEPRILKELNEADVIVCQLSPDFLHSDYSMITELPLAIKRKTAGQAELVAYVLRDCNWRETQFRHFQILPLDARPLRAWADQDSYWRAVAEGIQEALKAFRRPVRSGGGYEKNSKNRSGDTKRAQR